MLNRIYVVSALIASYCFLSLMQSSAVQPLGQIDITNEVYTVPEAKAEIQSTEMRVEGLLFAAFATLGFASLLMPQFLLLLPLGITYMSMMNVMGVKRIMAAILGLVTPLWLVYGTVYVYQPADVLLIPLNAGIHSLMAVSFAEPLPIRLLLTFADLAVLLPAAVLFAGSPVPGKPILRRRLEFLMLTCVWLMLLSWLYGNDFGLFYVWRLPAIAIFVVIYPDLEGQ